VASLVRLLIIDEVTGNLYAMGSRTQAVQGNVQLLAPGLLLCCWTACLLHSMVGLMISHSDCTLAVATL
jgi:hypothetical protein